jgi:putative ABC transport system permease protein
MLIALAWKNIWRNKKRSLIVIIAITFGLWGGLMSGAIMMGMSESMIVTAIERDIAHIQIHKKTYSQNKDVRNYIPDGIGILNQVRENPEVKAASGRTLIYGMAASPASTFGVKIVGIDPQVAEKVTTINKHLIDGAYFPGSTRNPIVLGKKLADRLNLKLKSKIVLSFEGLNGEIVYIACRVVGIYKTESAQFDEMNVFVNQNDLFRILDTEPIIHEIAIRLNQSEALPLVDAQLKEQFKQLKIQNWKELAPDLAFLAETMKSFTYLFVAIILFALLFGITNTMLMSIMDRVRELGVLIAVGMKKFKVFLMILTETIFLSLTGGILGILIGGASIAYFNFAGIDLSAFSASMESFGASTSIFPYLPLAMYIVLTIMIVVAANFAAIMPAWKAIHLQPSEAIRTY